MADHAKKRGVKRALADFRVVLAGSNHTVPSVRRIRTAYRKILDELRKPGSLVDWVTEEDRRTIDAATPDIVTADFAREAAQEYERAKANLGATLVMIAECIRDYEAIVAQLVSRD